MHNQNERTFWISDPQTQISEATTDGESLSFRSLILRLLPCSFALRFQDHYHGVSIPSLVARTCTNTDNYIVRQRRRQIEIVAR